MQRKIITKIDNESAGTRLDQWLAKRYSYQSRAQWQDLIKRKKILLNNSSTKSSRVLNCNDTVEFLTDDFNEPEVNMDYRIIYENDDIIAINKPPDLPCHPAGGYFNNTLFSILTKDLNIKLYLIHRLDRETSGVILFAKNSAMAKKLSKLFSSRNINKEYVVAVHGNFPDKLNTYGYLTDDTSSIIRKKRKFIESKNLDAVTKNHETAETTFKLIQKNNNMSLVRVLPKTGRLHQIRATLCSLGYPVVGDKIYGLDDTYFEKFINDNLTESDKKLLKIPHQALHAFKLSFIYPENNKIFSIEAEIPNTITNLFK